MSEVRFWGQSAFNLFDMQNQSYHHDVFINPRNKGFLELFICTSSAVKLDVTLDGQGTFKIVSLNVFDGADTRSSVVVFKPEAIGQLNVTIDGMACPSVKWDFSTKKKVVFDMFNRPLYVSPQGTWDEPKDAQFVKDSAQIDLLKNYFEAKDAETRDAFKAAFIAGTGEPEMSDFFNFVLGVVSDKIK